MKLPIRIFFLAAFLVTVAYPAVGYVPEPARIGVADIYHFETVLPSAPIPEEEITTPTIEEWSSGRSFSGCFTIGYANPKTRVPGFVYRWVACNGNPVNYIDPTGKWTGFVHGTWSRPDKFSPGFISAVLTSLNDSNMEAFGWDEPFYNNKASARTIAAKKLLDSILNVPAGEPINLVGHSHGGNVILETTHLLAKHNQQTGQNIQINNIILLNTPIVDYNPNYVPDMSVVGAANVFSVAFDPVQVNGGSDWSADLATYAFLLFHPKKGGERGSAKRVLDIPGVNNVVFGEKLLKKYGLSPMSLTRAHSFLKEDPGSNNSFWQSEIDRRLYSTLPGTN